MTISSGPSTYTPHAQETAPADHAGPSAHHEPLEAEFLGHNLGAIAAVSVSAATAAAATAGPISYIQLPVLHLEHPALRNMQITALDSLMVLMQLAAIKVPHGQEQPYLHAAEQLQALIQILGPQPQDTADQDAANAPDWELISPDLPWKH